VKGVKVVKKSNVLFFTTFLVFTAVVSCRNSPEAGPLQVTLKQIEAPRPARGSAGYAVVVTGFSGQELRALRTAQWGDEAWQSLLRVTVADNQTAAVAGRYVVTNDALQFEPRFPFDPGRSYAVRLDPAKLPAPRAGTVVEQSVALPARAHVPTAVTAISPSAGVWPENVLRFYIHFSAPMSATSSADFVRLVDDRGRNVEEAFLALDVDLWNEDYTRCTVFFDPGRVKRGVGPNLELGRAIREGHRYAIVVDAAWKDASGQPLTSAFRHELTAGPPVERGLSVSDWRLAPPAAGTRDPLVVTFPWALDRALLSRAVGVTLPDGRGVNGDIAVGPGETTWRFTPSALWPAGDYRLAILTLLEDPSGNRVGRAFEIKAFERGDRTSPQERVTIPFSIK
jgi:hypothetical protein